MKINLLYSLPDDIIIEVYDFDTTYRFFNKLEFKKELIQAYLKLKSTQKKCINEITNYIESIIDEGCQWHNEYGKIDPDNEFNENIPNYESIDEFFIYLHPFDDILYYKILPKTEEKLKFLNNPSCFDGFFCEREKNEDLICGRFQKKYNLHHDVNPIYSFNNSMEIVNKKICMWF